MSSRVVVALRVAAPPQRAFDVFTREISLWWRPNGLFQFTPKSPGVLSFELGTGGRLIETLPGGKVFEIGKTTAWEPPHRLAFSWRQASFAPDQMTHVEVRFEAVGHETRVTVEHLGWDSVPASHAARHRLPHAEFLQRHAKWWQNLLTSFNETVAHAQGRDL
jgi:uncharacterized protein YndB with AHSA1/START domain